MTQPATDSSSAFFIRDNGYYWVKVRGYEAAPPSIMEWSGARWYVAGIDDGWTNAEIIVMSPTLEPPDADPQITSSPDDPYEPFNVFIRKDEAAFLNEQMHKDDVSPSGVVMQALRVYQLFKLGYLGETSAYRKLCEPAGCRDVGN